MSVNQIRPTLEEVAQERLRQVDQWGHQNHPDGTGLYQQAAASERSRRVCEQNFYNGKGSWADILREEFHEALAESDPAALRAELIQVAAVACAWVEAIDRRANPPAPEASAGVGEGVAHDCRDGCTGSDPALDRWNERHGHWYCPNGNDNCAAHKPTATSDPAGTSEQEASS